MSYNQNEGQIYSFSIQVFLSFLSFPSIFNFPPFRIHNLKPYGYGTTPLLVWHLLVLERLFLAPWFMSASFSFTAGSNSGEQLQLRAKWKRITILTILPWVLNIFFYHTRVLRVRGDQLEPWVTWRPVRFCDGISLVAAPCHVYVATTG